jgi:GT2 family glycosyltransferase
MMNMKDSGDYSVAIIIINWRDYNRTLACLEDVNKAANIPFETIVVDNESEPDRHTDLKETSDITVVNTQNRGFTGGANDGLEVAEKKGFDTVVFLNNDTKPKDGFLEPLVKAVSCPEIGAAGGLIFDEDSNIWFGQSDFSPWMV